MNYPFKLMISILIIFLLQLLILTMSLLQLLLTCPSPGSCICSRQTTSSFFSRLSTSCVDVVGPLIYPWCAIEVGFGANDSDPVLYTAGLPYKARPREVIPR